MVSAAEIAEFTPVAWKRNQAAKAGVAEARAAIAAVARDLVYRDATSSAALPLDATT